MAGWARELLKHVNSVHRTNSGTFACLPGDSISAEVFVMSREALLRSPAVSEWLESPYLSRIASRVAYEHGLPMQDAPDLLQDLRLALWAAGADTAVNATWVYHTANHKAVDLLIRNRRDRLATWSGTKSAIAGRTCDFDLPHLLQAKADRLPERIRRYYYLRYREGLSQREIATRLGVCRSSVRWMDRQCLRMMKRAST